MTDNSQIPSKDRFKSYLRKIGSGVHTGRGMSRKEAAEALELMLTAQATPAQIGAFMIAHRIRRPEPQELAGMLDTYIKLGPKLTSKKAHQPPICFCMPFDGRNRTSPIYPLTTLILISAGQPVVLHGGKRMPTKYGVTTSELFGSLGLNLNNLSLQQVQTGFNDYGLAVISQPDHFPLADNLIIYREEIGKRPPIASMELIWTAHHGEHLLVSGFVHPPTEERAWKALELSQTTNVVTTKGLEGSTDLPTSRTCIAARVRNYQPERLILQPHKHNCYGDDVTWSNLKNWSKIAIQALENQGPLKNALQWNAGVYLWLSGISKSLQEGIDRAQAIMSSGSGGSTLKQLISWRKNL